MSEWSCVRIHDDKVLKIHTEWADTLMTFLTYAKLEEYKYLRMKYRCHRDRRCRQWCQLGQTMTSKSFWRYGVDMENSQTSCSDSVAYISAEFICHVLPPACSIQASGSFPIRPRLSPAAIKKVHVWKGLKKDLRKLFSPSLLCGPCWFLVSPSSFHHHIVFTHTLLHYTTFCHCTMKVTLAVPL